MKILAIVIGASLLTGSIFAAPKDGLSKITKNKTGWQEFRVYKDGEPIETSWGYQKPSGKWKIVKLKDGEWTESESADSLKGKEK